MNILVIILFLLLPGAAHADITSGLVAWWKLDDGAGSSAADSSSGNTATLVNSPSWGSGFVGGGLTFNGSNTVARNTSFSPTSASEITVSFWANVTDNTGSYRAFFAARQAGGNDYQTGINIDMGSSSTSDFSKLNVEGIGAGGETDLMTGAYSFGTWHHITVVFGVPTVTLYVDGTAQGTRARSASTISFDEVRFGARHYGGSEQGYLKAAMDEIRVYNRALTSGDVLELYRYSGQKTNIRNAIIRNAVIR